MTEIHRTNKSFCRGHLLAKQCDLLLCEGGSGDGRLPLKWSKASQG